MIWWIIRLENYTLFAPFTVSVNPYADTVIIKNWLAYCHFELKLPNAFSAFHPAANTCHLKGLYNLLVSWQYGTHEFGFWHDYNRSGTLTFMVKMAGLSRYYRSDCFSFDLHIGESITDWLLWYDTQSDLLLL